MTTRAQSRATVLALTCPICLDILTSPVVTDCGHAFCNGCIRRALVTTCRQCPTCRVPIASHRCLRSNVAVTDLTGSEPARVLGLMMDAAGETWACTNCTLRNTLAADRCMACDARRPATAVPRPPSSDLGRWPLRKGPRLGPKATPATASHETPSNAGHGGEERLRAADADAGDGGEERLRAADADAGPLPTACKSKRKRFSFEPLTPHEAAIKRHLDPHDPPPVRGAFAEYSKFGKADKAWNERERTRRKKIKVRNEMAEAKAAQRLGSSASTEHAAVGAKEAAVAAKEAALAEGLSLIPASNSSGFKGVTLDLSRGRFKSFKAQVKEGGASRRIRNLGCFRTAEEAALTYARYVKRRDGVAEVVREKRPPLTAQEARQAAADEGLDLKRSPRSNSGYANVMQRVNHGGRFTTSGYKKRLHTTHLGTYDTAEEAALMYARYMRSRKAA
eukprot:CAMPEP_0119299518 /NCGR_PEP_ID=MMETSP1333-20130426/1599_1 /TAXON_ID=418940 /ORGANISM="Scyphosphaera apsteinii, Strain RCC1455" /LENGTH=449 /DNA_ID=CAMNT_0007300971 /DNA_START=145 /DNA_END=1494 /DNA_ORIENTATION=+